MSRKTKTRKTKSPPKSSASNRSPSDAPSKPLPSETEIKTKDHTMEQPNLSQSPQVFYSAPPSNVPAFSFLFQILLSAGIVLLALKLAPQVFLGSQASSSCKVKHVKYDPAGNAVVSFVCGNQEKDVTIARGKPGPQGKSCTMEVERNANTTTLAFRCGKETKRVTLKAMQPTIAPVAKPTAALPKPRSKVAVARQAAPRPRPAARPKTVVARKAPRPRPRPVVRQPAKRKVALRTKPRGHGHDHDGKHGHNHDKKVKRPSWTSLSFKNKTVSLVGAPVVGPKSANVRVVVFSDFQCPFCSRGANRLEQIKERYKGKVRIYFKHLPLNFHKDAHLAAQASMAAHAQGKFWAYHDKLFVNQNRLKKADLIKYAKELKLNIGKFKKALDTQTYKNAVDNDMRHAAAVGVNGTPAFFVNQKRVMGARPFKDFRKLIDGILGIKSQPKQAPSLPRFSNISTGSSPSWGPKNAKVKIVEFSDFECPFCARGASVIRRIKDSYKNVRVVFKHFPLRNHINAPLAAQASMEAHKQGKFWEYHDKLFQNQRRLKKADLIRYAKELGLNMSQFKSALDKETHKGQLNADMRQAQRLGVSGTPIFYINGYKIAGAYPYSYFEKVINATLAGKTPPKFVPPKRQREQAPSERKDIPVNPTDPVDGPKNAPITIVEFSDFECKYCGRGGRMMKAARRLYGDKVRVVFKHKPLPNHPNARIAAQASMAAHAQGKFWEYQSELFKNSSNLGMATYLRIAKKVGLNLKRFEKELKGGVYRKIVERDLKLANRIGVHSTPMFYVNGHPLLGAQPLFQFQRVIDALLAKKQPPTVPLTPPKNPNPIPIAVRHNDPGFGPKNAKITVVEFSDFECGFCSKVASTVAQLKKAYGKQVRFVFKHLPIKIHKDAHLASQASLAAHEQGKFWEFHDLLFQNQRKLKRADLLNYARQLNLNIKKFKASLDSGKHKDFVSDDYEQARWYGIDGTPTFVINGKKVVGAVSFARFKQIFDAILYATPAKK